MPENPEEIGRWCRAIARNLVKHYWWAKGRSKLALMEDLGESLDLAYSEQDANADVWNEQRQLLGACLKRLSAEAVDLLKVCYIQGESMIDVARRLGRSADAIRTRVMRIRNRLKECVEGRSDQSGELDHGF
jgi:RNA polymerase sigma-70 factor (ECF subfamily)